MFLGLLIAALVLVFDQLTKFLMQAYVLNEQPVIALTPFFNFVYAWNTGVSFSMFNDGGQGGAVLLCLAATAIVAALLWWLYREKIPVVRGGLGLIIGGALGNVVDRVRFGAVFDFLDFHLAGHHWPAFNLADSCICIGAVVIIAHSLLYPEKKTSEENKQ